MNRRLLTIVVVLVVVMAGAVGAYAYDTGREDVIADGVTAGAVDLGGMRTRQARRALRRELRPLLEAGLTVRHRARRFRLAPQRARVRVEVERMVADALRISREGNLLSRTVRDLAGRSVDAEVPLRLTYSSAAVRSFVRSVKRSLDRPPRNAAVRPAGAGLRRVTATSGIAVRRGPLERAISVALARRSGRVVSVPVDTRTPAVTDGELADRYATFITIDRASFRLRLFKRLRLVRTYRVGVGRAGFETPVGLYRIQNKAVNPSWFVPDKPWAGDLAGKVIPPGPDNPIKARWLGIYDGAGIHGTADVASIGTAASHGCIRMLISEVKQLYERVPVGASVYVQ